MALGITCLRSGHRRLGENRGEAVECLLECVLGLDPAPPSPGCVTLGKTRTNLCFSSHICEGSRVIQAPSWVVVRIKWVTIFTCFEQLQALSAFLVLEVGSPLGSLVEGPSLHPGCYCHSSVFTGGEHPQTNIAPVCVGLFPGVGNRQMLPDTIPGRGSSGVGWVGSVQFLGTH